MKQLKKLSMSKFEWETKEMMENWHCRIFHVLVFFKLNYINMANTARLKQLFEYIKKN